MIEKATVRQGAWSRDAPSRNTLLRDTPSRVASPFTLGEGDRKEVIADAGAEDKASDRDRARSAPGSRTVVREREGGRGLSVRVLGSR